MPRQSAESRAAAAFQAGSAPPVPPKSLSKEAAALWREIVASKPTDWFDPGSRPLLEQYCVLFIYARALNRRIARLMKNGAWDELKPWEKRRNQLTVTLSTLAGKLRLSVQANVDWHSRKIGERGNSPDQPKPGARSTLLGGEAVWGREGGKPN